MKTPPQGGVDFSVSTNFGADYTAVSNEYPSRNFICVFLAEVKFQDVAQAVAREPARFRFTALNALDGPCADITVLCQLFLRQAFLLSEFGDFESKVRLVHEFLLWRYTPIIESYPKFAMS